MNGVDVYISLHLLIENTGFTYLLHKLNPCFPIKNMLSKNCDVMTAGIERKCTSRDATKVFEILNT